MKKEENVKKDEEIKIILVGESGTGKTSLMNTAQGLPFVEGNQISTMISSFVKLSLTIDGVKYYINLWDTIGQERYRALTRVFLNESKIVIFVFDITSKESFDELDYWMNLIENELPPNVIKAIAANKSDLIDENENVDEDTIKELCEKKGIEFKYTSAKNIDSFNKLLNKLIIKYISKQKEKEIKNNNNKGTKIKKGNVNNNNKERKCC